MAVSRRGVLLGGAGALGAATLPFSAPAIAQAEPIKIGFLAAIIKYWNTLTKYPGYFGDYTFTPTQHNGYPTDEIVMSAASTAKNGTFALAPGYS